MEVFADDDEVLVRDSKHPQGGRLALAPEVFAAFIEDVKAGRINR